MRVRAHARGRSSGAAPQCARSRRPLRVTLRARASHRIASPRARTREPPSAWRRKAPYVRPRPRGSFPSSFGRILAVRRDGGPSGGVQVARRARHHRRLARAPPPGRSGKVALDERVATDFENGQVRRTAVPAARSPVSSRPTIPRRNARDADPRGGHHRASRHPPAFAATPPAHRDEVFPASPLPRDARDASPLASSHSRLTRDRTSFPPPPIPLFFH